MFYKFKTTISSTCDSFFFLKKKILSRFCICLLSKLDFIDEEQDESKFAALIQAVLTVGDEGASLSWHERTAIVQFLIYCFQSLENVSFIIDYY
jgi:hypothetical protein